MKRAVVLLVLLVTGLSSAFLLPDFRLVESAIRLEIPGSMVGWTSHPYEASIKEKKILAPDTKFSKAACLRPRWSSTALYGNYPTDRADLSIVLSGFDLANSIHRPERCMAAQGHKIYRSEKSLIDLPQGRHLPVRRLLSTQQVQLDPSKEDLTDLDAVTFYFFVGHDHATEDHTQRTLIDIKDRLFKGQAQRWAYLSATMWFDGDNTPDNSGLSSLESADAAIRGLLAELATRNINWEQMAN